MGSQRRQERPHAEESQLQRHHHGVLEFLRRYLQARRVDAVGHSQLWKRPAHADHGNGPRRLTVALPQREDRRGLRQMSKRNPKKHAALAAPSKAASQLTSEREVRRIIDTVLRLAESTDADETEVHVDETISALTRFANNAIHQNVAEHTMTVSIRTVVDQRTARATTNRLDQDSLRS